jgi:hypothetical protein
LQEGEYDSETIDWDDADVVQAGVWSCGAGGEEAKGFAR